MTQRTGKQRLDAIRPAIARGEAFRARIADADGDTVRCADLMAEAIDMIRESNGCEVVGRDGRAVVSIEELEAFYCADAARTAYLKARGSNSTPSRKARAGS